MSNINLGDLDIDLEYLKLLEEKFRDSFYDNK